MFEKVDLYCLQNLRLDQGNLSCITTGGVNMRGENISFIGRVNKIVENEKSWRLFENLF